MMYKKAIFCVLSLILIFSTTPVKAQTPTTVPGPYYIIQDGDTLWDIAVRFNVNMADIMSANNMTNQNIFAGNQLIIPGLDGFGGTLVTRPVPFGETLRTLSRQYRLDPAQIIKLNRLVTPAELYAGYNLIVLQNEALPILTTRDTLNKGDTLLELAVRQNTDPWTIALLNGLTHPQTSLPGDVLYFSTGTSTVAPTGIPAILTSAEVDALPIIQGTTVQIKVTATQPVTLSGSLLDHTLNFFQQADGSQVALQGVHAMTEPGVYPLQITITPSDGSMQSFEQMVLVTSGDFLEEIINGVEPETIDPAVTVPEDEWLRSLVSTVTPEKYWQGIFQLPVDSQNCLRSRYGNRRTYNGGVLYSFHSGLDFGVCSDAHPFEIYAPAAGVVVFTGLKTVRGNATIIDHGQGIYSGYYHQEEIYVSVGDQVTVGQVIGMIGATGRVTGKHLHWEVWANGVQVNPIQWLDEVFPH